MVQNQDRIGLGSLAWAAWPGQLGLCIFWPITSKPWNFLIAPSIRRFDILKKTGEPAPSFNIPRKNQHSKWSPIKNKPTSKPISQKYILKKIGEPDETYFGNMGFKFPKKRY
jgi:hypothetical protein